MPTDAAPHSTRHRASAIRVIISPTRPLVCHPHLFPVLYNSTSLASIIAVIYVSYRVPVFSLGTVFIVLFSNTYSLSSLFASPLLYHICPPRR